MRLPLVVLRLVLFAQFLVNYAQLSAHQLLLTGLLLACVGLRFRAAQVRLPLVVLRLVLLAQLLVFHEPILVHHQLLLLPLHTQSKPHQHCLCTAFSRGEKLGRCIDQRYIGQALWCSESPNLVLLACVSVFFRVVKVPVQRQPCVVLTPLFLAGLSAIPAVLLLQYPVSFVVARNRCARATNPQDCMPFWRTMASLFPVDPGGLSMTYTQDQQCMLLQSHLWKRSLHT